MSCGFSLLTNLFPLQYIMSKYECFVILTPIANTDGVRIFF